MHRKLARLALCFSVLGFSLGLQAAAPELHLTVAPDRQGREINPMVMAGYNFGNWMNMVDFGERMSKDVPPATLRFPGGNVGDDQDLKFEVLNLFATNLGLLKATDLPVVVQTRVFQGRVDQVPGNRPEDAAEAARIARQLKLKVAYWQIGNEPDLFAVTRGDASWTAERYCEVFRAQANAIRAVDPEAKFAGPGVSGAVPNASNFLAGFVKGCGDVVDFLTWHIYPTDGTGSEEAAFSKIEEPGRWFKHYRELWADPAKNPLGHKRQIKFGMTEYGLSWVTNNPIYLADMPAAMFAVGTALNMSSEGMDAAYYFAYQGVFNHGLLDQDGFPRPTYYAFRMVRPLRGHFVEASTGDKTVWTWAVRDGEKLSVILMNTRKESLDLPVDLPGWKLVGGEWFDQALVEDEAPTKTVSPSARVALPARAMMRLDFSKP